MNTKRIIRLIGVVFCVTLICVMIYILTGREKPMTDEERAEKNKTIYTTMAPDLEYNPYVVPLDGFYSVMRTTKDLDKALFWADAVVEVYEDPREGVEYFYRGLAYEMAKQYPKATECYEKSLPHQRSANKNYQNSVISIFLGRCYYYIGNRKESTRQYCNWIRYAKMFNVNNMREFSRLMKEYLISNDYGLSQPFSSSEELISFLERSSNEYPDLKKECDEAIVIIKELQLTKWAL